MHSLVQSATVSFATTPLLLMLVDAIFNKPLSTTSMAEEEDEFSKLKWQTRSKAKEEERDWDVVTIQLVSQSQEQNGIQKPVSNFSTGGYVQWQLFGYTAMAKRNKTSKLATTIVGTNFNLSSRLAVRDNNPHTAIGHILRSAIQSRGGCGGHITRRP